MIFWPIVALVTVLLLVGAVRYGQPALEHRKHARTLAHIARLEIELGIVPPPRDSLSRFEAGLLAVARPAVLAKPPDGLYVLCDRCRTHVRLDKNACPFRGIDRNLCAIYLYKRNANGPA